MSEGSETPIPPALEKHVEKESVQEKPQVIMDLEKAQILARKEDTYRRLIENAHNAGLPTVAAGLKDEMMQVLTMTSEEFDKSKVEAESNIRQLWEEKGKTIVDVLNTKGKVVSVDLGLWDPKTESGKRTVNKILSLLGGESFVPGEKPTDPLMADIPGGSLMAWSPSDHPTSIRLQLRNIAWKPQPTA